METSQRAIATHLHPASLSYPVQASSTDSTQSAVVNFTHPCLLLMYWSWCIWNLGNFWTYRVVFHYEFHVYL